MRTDLTCSKTWLCCSSSLILIERVDGNRWDYGEKMMMMKI